MRSFDELRFEDNFMFTKVMSDLELCREVLECLLQRQISNLQEVQTEKEIQFRVDGKPIRLDVYNRDRVGNLYNTELQNLNHHSVESLDLPKRSRFYQSSMDMDILDKGDRYKELPESNILFICTFDPFEIGLGRYSFRERCDEEPNLILQNGIRKVFYNCCYNGNDLPEDLGFFYEYIRTGTVGNTLTERIEAAVVKGRMNQIWRSQYMRERLILQDAKDEGRLEGRLELIETMLRKGKKAEEIADFCELPLAQIKEIEQNMLAAAK